MTREEAEEIFIPIVLSDDGGVAKMTAQEFQAFSVFVGEILKDMEKDNKELWLRAKKYALDYNESYAIIKNMDMSRYKKLFVINEDGSITENNKESKP